ncbi:MAG: hypothetical protein Q9M43_15105 [Sulfurimonas sp.]|nr:hypothetical protein [Sulfurimonas sp.]
MSKRTKTTTQNKSKILKAIAWVLAVIALVMASITIGYLLGYDKASSEITKKRKLKSKIN